jgi:23S rRNA pseudouridine2457 synthase
MPLRYFAICKPFNMLSQFSREGEHATLADLPFDFPQDVYPVGRLDADSEGLLLLSNDKQLNHALLDPSRKHPRTYFAQVEGTVNENAIAQLKKGVSISINGKKHLTLPAVVKALEDVKLFERNPPIRYRKNVPDSWISLTLTEGKNRQVRRMTAAVGFPTLRLVRVSIEQLELGNMLPGDVREFERDEFYRLLRLR